MAVKDPRVDAYIAKAEPFAQPILNHLRNLVHQTIPEIRETIKWGFPHFECKEVICSMASFKNHCAFTFWKGAQMKDPENIFILSGEDKGMGQLGKISSFEDLPSDSILKNYLLEALELSEKTVTLPKSSKRPTTELVIPEYFQTALENNPTAFAAFSRLSYSNKKEYIAWIEDAKTENTRNKRISTALEWISEGKSRNWKYEKKK